MGIPPDVDDVAEITIGVVVRIAAALFMTFCYMLAPQSSILIANLATLIVF